MVQGELRHPVVSLEQACEAVTANLCFRKGQESVVAVGERLCGSVAKSAMEERRKHLERHAHSRLQPIGVARLWRAAFDVTGNLSTGHRDNPVKECVKTCLWTMGG